MQEDNLLEPLVSTIRTTRNVIEQHRAHVSKNEIRTRNILIDPVLRALGWDVSVLEDVEVEYGAGKQRVDYALLGEGRKPLVLIEAKKLDEELNSKRTQMLTYCTEIGVRYGVLTDGNCWDLYDLWQEASMDERRILQVIIGSRQPAIAAQMLLILWKEFIREGGLSANNGRATRNNAVEKKGENTQ